MAMSGLDDTEEVTEKDLSDSTSVMDEASEFAQQFPLTWLPDYCRRNHQRALGL